MTTYSLDLVPASDYDRASYGILLTSATQHDFTGRGIHNPHHRHTLQVWDNSRRPNREAEGAAGQAYLDPQHQPTDQRYSFRWSPHANVISLHQVDVLPAVGPTLRLGDVLTLNIHGYVIGEIQCRARSLQNPHGVLVDTASSASRQHFIETGEYIEQEA